MLIEDVGYLPPVAQFSPDGKLLATNEEGSEITLWSARDGEPVHRLLDSLQTVGSVVFSPDSDLLLSGGNSHSAKLWSTVSGARIGIEIPMRGRVRNLAFSEDGRMMACTAAGVVEVWSTDVQANPEITFPLSSRPWAIDFSPDGSELLIGGASSVLDLWSIHSGTKRTQFSITGYVFDAAFSPDGDSVAAVSEAGVRLFTRDGKQGALLGHSSARVRCIAYRPDGIQLATGDFEGSLRLWDVPSGKMTEILPHPGIVEDIEFSLDGASLISACADGKARAWSLNDNTERFPALVHNDAVLAVGLSPDGELIATGSRDHTVRLWHAHTGQPTGVVLDHKDWVEDLEFSPDGRFLATACDGNLQLWSIETGEKFGPPFPHPRSVVTLEFDPRGARLLTAAEKVRLWTVSRPSPQSIPVVDLGVDIQAMVGKSIDENGRLSRLPRSVWRELRAKLSRRSDPDK